MQPEPQPDLIAIFPVLQGPLDDPYATSIRNCDAKGPLMVYVSKMIPSPDKVCKLRWPQRPGVVSGCGCCCCFFNTRPSFHLS